MTEGCTPLEVPPVLELRDYDLAVRCLEVVRSHISVILPAGVQYRVEAIALCHHHPDNVYPAFGVFGAEQMADVEDAETRINVWVAERGLEWLVAESQAVTAPSWASLRAGRVVPADDDGAD
ncbi:MAG: hypothetical protein ACRDD1_00385 [Planctomycetia bacterium]